MNVFETLFFNMILILFPILIYIIFLTCDKSIDKKTKGLLFDGVLLSSLFLVYKYNHSAYIITSFLTLNILILVEYIKTRVISANIIALLLIIMYYNYFNITIFMAIPYLVLFVLYYLKDKKGINDFYFIDLFLLAQYLLLIIWIIIFNNNLYISLGLIDTIIILLFNYLTIHLIYLLYNYGEKVINYNINYKKLKYDTQIKMSLFKITHEIKNPIAVIKAYLDMINTKDSEQIEKYIPIIKSEIARLLNLLQDFLLVNKANIIFDIMDINMLLEEIIMHQKPLFEEKHIILNNNLIDDEIYINGDYNRLSQVIINIIKNSIEALEYKTLKFIKIKSYIKGNKINIIIEDNGSGISKKNLKKIKEPFYTTKNRGTGLGVSLSDEIIKAHSGDLLYESAEGKGTKVIIKLPLYGKEKLC